jgi:glycosyltransferase involved in cell wall biosynthesis
MAGSSYTGYLEAPPQGPMDANTPPWNVLLFTSSPHEGGEGADTQLAATIADRVSGAEFTWFTQWPVRGRRSLSHGRPIPILSRDGGPGLSERLQIAAVTCALTRRADLVHAVLTIGRDYPLFSRWHRYVFGNRPVVHTVPGVVNARYLERAQPLGTTIALSEATAHSLRLAGFGDVRVVLPGIPLERWPRRPRRNGTRTVLFAGHYGPGAGAEEAILAAGAAVRAGSRLRLVLAMRRRRRQDEQALRSGLLALARREGLLDVCVYGHVRDMPALLDSADVLLFTPQALGGKADIPLIVLEALATGRPAILSDLPQFARLRDAVARAPVGDCQRAGFLLATLLDEPRWWEDLADRGRRLVETSFGTRPFAEKHEQIYRELLG